MEPLTMALIAGGVKAALPGIIGGINQYGAAQDLKLTPAQLARLKKLERLQGLDALGMTDPQREQYRSMALSPVQTAEREAMARFGASQQIADIGQGASFRQQQALADTGKAARAEVSQAVAARDAQVAQQQAQELAALQEQQKQKKAMERQAVLSALGGVAEGGLGAMEIYAEKKMAKQEYEKTLEKMNESGKNVAESTRKMLGIGKNIGETVGKNAGMNAVEGMRATDASLGGDGNRAIEGMIQGDEERLAELMPFLQEYNRQQGYNKPVQEYDENLKKLLMMYTNPMGAY